ncbi:MAG: repair protein RecN, partial [Bacteroidota bacterium]
MLERLFIQNYAIIAELEISFSKGLVIITGETGAGKSILMGALGLALGDRADSSQLRDKDKKTVIEAVFKTMRTASMVQFFNEADIELEEEIILRREIQSSGKSRAFINDTPVSLAQLQQLATILVDLHQQFDTLELGNKHFQRVLLDARAECMQEMVAYTDLYSQSTAIQKKIAAIEALLQKAQQERDYKLFLLNELEELNWTDGEARLIEEELDLLSHADQIRLGVGKIGFVMNEGEQPLIPQIRSMVSQLQSLASHHPSLPALVARLESSYVEIKDISNDLESLLDGISVDDKRMEQLNERLANAQRLSKKHALPAIDDLVGQRIELSNELAVFETSQDELTTLQKQLQTLHASATALASVLSKKRKAQVPVLEAASTELLKRVGMPNASLKIDLKPIALSASGTEDVSFLFDANKSGHYEPLHKVASGGELSRLMLVLKSLVAGSLEMPTLIFDEIDSGISGEAAKQVGVLMEELAINHQLIAITHQPQIAARANQHLYVFKQEQNGSITTSIRVLSEQERIQTIAKMLAGENPSEAVLASAREMMK